MTHIVRLYDELLSNLKEWNKQGWTIKSDEEKLLQLYIGNFYSVYDIQSYLKTAVGYKNMHRRIFISNDYKNIHRKVQKLKKLKLIEEQKLLNKKSIHGAKYYRLSEKGILHIILRTSSFIGEYQNITQIFKLLHANYPESFIFHLFVTPYIDYRTVETIYGSAQVTAFWRYVRKCCEAATNLIDFHGGEQIFIWSDLPLGYTYKLTGLRDTRLVEFLEKRFNLNWLRDAQILKFGNDRTVKIAHFGKSIVIELDDTKSKASLKINRQEIMKLNVTVLRDKQNKPYVFDICAPPQSTQQIEHLKSVVKMLATELVFELLSYPIIENDIKVLSQDSKLPVLINEVKQIFDERCTLILGRR